MSHSAFQGCCGQSSCPHGRSLLTRASAGDTQTREGRSGPVSCGLFVTPWTVARQAPLSMEFSRQEYWSRLPFASPWDLPDRGFKPGSPALQADFSASEPLGNSMYESSQYSSCCRFSKVCIFLSFHAFYVIMLPEMWIYLGWRKSERKAPISLSLSS